MYYLHGMNTEPLPVPVVPLLPNGKVAVLEIDQSPALPHNCNCHGWPANYIQEYMNRENVSIAEMQLKNLQIQESMKTGLEGYTDEQKAALCVSRSAQSASEFTDEALRVSKVKERIDSLRNRQARPVEPFKDDVKKTDEQIIDES